MSDDWEYQVILESTDQPVTLTADGRYWLIDENPEPLDSIAEAM